MVISLPLQEPFRVSAIHHRHRSLGAQMVLESGWLRPERYTSPEDEAEGTLKRVGMCDLSPLGKLDLKGKGVERLLRAMTDEIPGRIGEVRRMSLEGGSDLGDYPLCFRLSTDHAMILTAPDDRDGILAGLQKEASSDACVTDITSGFAAMDIAGPRSVDLLAKLTEIDLTPGALPNYSCAEAPLAEVYSVLIRHDLRACHRFTLLVTRDYGEYVWDTISHAGSEFQIRPYGTAAHRILEMKR